ncbi:M23 family metallopeptidase [Nonomuraea insulae]|uniref:M23 family metallopeptidase n=1 Tax=Nonomuraea insulae TaxID=1616787 RepID=A0ABW1DDV1_9ACTN
MRLSGVTIVGVALLFSLGTASAAAADPTPAPSPLPTVTENAQVLAAPSFQLPFPCEQAWTGNSSGSSAHKSYEIDFNRGSTAEADKGDTVVAAAAGTVAISAQQGSTNGFGNLVKIDHGGGYATYYARLNSRTVSAGQPVRQGQKIGTVGNTSKPGNNCVATLKAGSIGTASAVSAYLEVAGSTRKTDSGNFAYYAGPVVAAAPGKCVKWGGKAGSDTYNSPSEHCGS